MYECFYCGGLASGENKIEVNVNPDETVGLYGYKLVYCASCEDERMEDGEAFKETAKEYATELAIEEES